jgi:NADP-dependent 3-hydroxy acid dehydrogenase YdfG
MVQDVIPMARAKANSTKPLTGKTAIVTGASSGIGQAAAEHLAGAGAAVVLNARRGERLKTLAAKITAAGGRALAVPGDASDHADLDALVERALAWAAEGGGASGGLDIVVANAGRGLAGGVVSSAEAEWEPMYKVNVLGAAHLLRRAAEVMVRQGSGDIVVLGSVVGRNVSPFSGFYGASKFAIIAAAEALRREVCGKGVRVTVVEPGIVESEFQQVAGYTPENFGQAIKRFGTLLQPADIARAIVFAVSQPAHVHVSEIMVRPTGQDYP